MAIPTSMDATWLNPASVSLNAAELRRADSTAFNGDATAFGVRGGIVRHGDTSLSVTISVADVVTVQPGAVVVPGNSGVGNGCYRTALDAAITGSITARNATNPRIDLVIFRVLDTDVVGTHGAYTGRIEILPGTPAASPVAPALPTLAVELGRITVPIAGGAAATVDSSNRQYITAVGGRLPVPSFSKLPAADSKWDQAVALDTGVEYTWNGTTWVADPTVDTSGWTAVTFQGAWVNFGSTYQTVQYKRIGNRVWLRGAAKSGVSGTVAFTLPAGFRPPADLIFPISAAGAFGQITVASDGTAIITAASTSSAHVNIQFEAA